MLHKLQVFILIILLPLGGFYLYAQQEGKTLREILQNTPPLIHIGEMSLRVIIANDNEERSKGLGGINDMQGFDGMLFVFDRADYHSMWMKDMKFAIDIIWIDENLKVVGIEKTVRPDTYPRKFYSPVPARYAVETKAEYTNTFGISVGDQVRIPLKLE